MHNLVSGKRLRSHWTIERPDLFRYIKEGLQPYDDKLGKNPVPPPNVSEILKRIEALTDELKHIDSLPMLKEKFETRNVNNMLFHIHRQISKLEKKYENLDESKASILEEIAKLESSLPKDDLYSWGHYNESRTDKEQYKDMNFIVSCYFRITDINEFAKTQGLKLPEFTNNTVQANNALQTSKSARYGKPREAIRQAAKMLWDNDKKLTIVDVINSEEIKKALPERGFTHDTLRKWIRDLCPNPKRGRPSNNRDKVA